MLDIDRQVRIGKYHPPKHAQKRTTIVKTIARVMANNDNNYMKNIIKFHLEPFFMILPDPRDFGGSHAHRDKISI